MPPPESGSCSTSRESTGCHSKECADRKPILSYPADGKGYGLCLDGVVGDVVVVGDEDDLLLGLVADSEGADRRVIRARDVETLLSRAVQNFEGAAHEYNQGKNRITQKIPRGQVTDRRAWGLCEWSSCRNLGGKAPTRILPPRKCPRMSSTTSLQRCPVVPRSQEKESQCGPTALYLNELNVVHHEGGGEGIVVEARVV